MIVGDATVVARDTAPIYLKLSRPERLVPVGAGKKGERRAMASLHKSQHHDRPC